MANYATNIFYASTENEKDLDKVEKFLDETFCDCYLDRAESFLFFYGCKESLHECKVSLHFGKRVISQIADK